MRVPRYVPESPELLAARAWEENTRRQSLQEADAGLMDRTKDLMFYGVRWGVPESYSHAYDAQVAA